MCGFDRVFERTTECSTNHWCIGPANMTVAVLGSSQFCKPGKQMGRSCQNPYLVTLGCESIGLEIYCLLTISAIIDCGGSQMAPGCKYCLANGDKLHNTWCSGSCEFDEKEGTCTEIKGTCKNTLYPLL